MTKLRKEHDSLGEITIPEDSVFGAQTGRAIQNYQISGRSSSPALIRAYLHVKRAAARVNQQLGSIESRHSALIQQAIEELLRTPEELWGRFFPVDVYQAGAGTSQNMNINEVVANFANRIAGNALGSYTPVHPNDHVNRSQSTNDTFPTAMRLAILEVSRPLVLELRKLSEEFLSKGREWEDIPKSARTHLQDAVPIRLGQEFTAYALTIQRCERWVEQGRDSLRELGIGGSAAGTGLTVPEGYAEKMIDELQQLTGEKLWLNPDLCESMQSQSPVSHYSSMLRITALELTRICNDLRLLASGPLTGLAEIILPAVQPGSSIMPGKVNPSILEMANQTWFSVLGYDQTVAFAIQAGQLELNVMMPVMAHAMIEASRIAAETSRTLREKCIEGLEANESRLRHYFESTPQVATALSPRLGYELTARLVQEALKTGESVIALVRKKNLIPEEELRSLLNVRALTGGK